MSFLKKDPKGNLMLTKFKYVRMKKLFIDVDKCFTNFSDLRG